MARRAEPTGQRSYTLERVLLWVVLLSIAAAIVNAGQRNWTLFCLVLEALYAVVLDRTCALGRAARRAGGTS